MNLLQKAKSRLSVTHPYFGMLASRLREEPSEKVRFYASNGVRFLYNPDFIATCNLETLQFILTNCAMHHVLAHQNRRLGRHGALWQLATDYAINDILKQSGLAIPQGANYNAEFRGLYAEEIYAQLKESYGESAFDDLSEEAQAHIEGLDGSLDPQTESQWQYTQSIAQQVTLQKSKMPSGLERLGKKVKHSGVDWRFELYNAINRHMRNNYAFMPPNKKHLWRGFALPSLASDTLSITVAIDTSGSIDEALLGAFMGEFETIMQSFPSIRIELLICDARIHAHHTFYGGDDLHVSLKGGGGTDYRPVFDLIDAELGMSTMLLYFTDGDGIFPRRAPGYEVLWALSREAKVPFGRALVIFEP